jgi:hypothetical protein
MTPNDYFVKTRNSVCTILREPSEVEEKAWHELLQSACRQNNVDFDSLGIVPSSTIEEVTADVGANLENSNGDEDEDEDGDDTFVDAPEEFNT